MDRNKEIVRTSWIGIITNILLTIFKAAIGLLSNSIAILMDAVNNLSDAMSSVITIIGTKLSEKPADRMHPFGHGRVEYLSAIVIAGIVLAAGVSSLIESVKKILHPTEPQFGTATFVIILLAIVTKLLLGSYVKRKGERLKSDALIASGSDALFDAVITLSTLLSALVMTLWQVSIDGYLGAIISAIIIKSGIEMLKSPINELLGRRVSPELVKQIKQEVMLHKGVKGVHDLILHTYGPDTMIGSLHVTVEDSTTAQEIYLLGREVSMRLMEKFGIICTVGFYVINTGHSQLAKIQQDIMLRVKAHPGIHSSHGFYVNPTRHIITFDITPQYEVQDKEHLRQTLQATLQAAYPDYTFSIVIDNNYSED